MDNTIFATAIPRITDQFKALDNVGWFSSACFLTTCAVQLLFDKFLRLVQRQMVVSDCTRPSELVLLSAEPALNSITIIVGRAIAGLGAADHFFGAQIICAYTVRLVNRAIFTRIRESTYGIASVTGPLLGGAYTDHVFLAVVLLNQPTLGMQSLQVTPRCKRLSKNGSVK